MADIRPMRPDEVRAAAVFTNLAWRAAYPGILDQDFLDGLTTDDRMERIQRRLDAGSRAWVAVEDEAIVGIAVAGHSTIAEYPDDGELQALYVHPDRIGQGLGHALIQRACDELEAQGHRHLILDVFAGNDRAIAFYRDHGFETIREANPTLDTPHGLYPLEYMRRAATMSLVGANVMLREARDADEDLVVGFLLELSAYHRARHDPRCTTDDYGVVRTAIETKARQVFRERGDDRLVLIAEVDGVAVGYASTTIIEQKPESDNGTGRVGLLDEVYVTERARSTGVGRRLIDASIEWLKGRGITRARLYVYAWNRRARTVYERYGFAESFVCYELFT